jgi:hypothetical protein
MTRSTRRPNQSRKMLKLCVLRTSTIARKGGNDARRREAAEDCEVAVKDALQECAALASRRKRPPEGRGKVFLDSLEARFEGDAVMIDYIERASRLQADAHAQAHHNARAEALRTERLVEYASTATELVRGIRGHCRIRYARPKAGAQS